MYVRSADSSFPSGFSFKIVFLHQEHTFLEMAETVATAVFNYPTPVNKLPLAVGLLFQIEIISYVFRTILNCYSECTTIYIEMAKLWKS